MTNSTSDRGNPVFGHQPPGAAKEHEITLIVDWDTAEPQHLVCDECGAIWPVGPRAAQIPPRA
jgi:hypothetical protein